MFLGSRFFLFSFPSLSDVALTLHSEIEDIRKKLKSAVHLVQVLLDSLPESERDWEQLEFPLIIAPVIFSVLYEFFWMALVTGCY